MAREQQVYVEDIDELKDEDMIQLVGFKLGDEEYAIDVLKIQEIIRLVEITSVPRMDTFVLGVMNLRGKVIPVIDLRVRFNLDRTDFDKKTRIIVVKFEKENVGFVVDEVTEVIRINKNMVEPTPPLVGSIGQEYILGICKYETRLIILLDIDSVIYENSQIDSDLKRRFSKDSDVRNKIIPDSSSNDSEGDDEENDHEPENIASSEFTELSSSAIKQQSSLKDIGAPEAFISDVSTDFSEDIDKLIAEELAKRERETEELLKKKKGSDDFSVNDSNTIDNVLNDALSQAESKVNAETSYVEQMDLDQLIAAELAMREKETEEMIKRKKEAEKKNPKLDVAASEEAEKKRIEESSITLMRDPISELRDLAKKIINGESKDIDINIQGEIGELLKLIMTTKQKIDELEPSIVFSSEKIPHVTKSLESVNAVTEEATLNLMEASDSMSSLYLEINDDLRSIESVLEGKDSKKALDRLNSIETKLAKAEDIGFRILQSLEFQDITEQKINKTIGFVESIGARLGAILGYVRLQQISDSSAVSSSQDDIDKLLSDFGLS